MSEKIKFSVIIPAYNADAYIGKCLESVLQNKKVSFEVLTVNDGSTDRTDQICKKWAHKQRNVVYLEQIHRGQGSARNLAVSHASGKWLVFLDADDELLPGALEYLDKNVSGEFDIFWYGSIFVKKNGTEYQRLAPSCVKDKKKIMQGMSTELWDKVFRTEFWRNEGILLSDRYGEDIYAVYMLAARALRIMTLPAPLMRHYEREDNLTSKPWRVKEVVQSISYVLQEFQERSLLEAYRTSLIFMLSAQHKAHERQWRELGRRESKNVAEELEKLAVRYFSEESHDIFRIEKESIIVIGKICEEISEALQLRDVYYYECMEQFLLDKNKIRDKICHFVVDVENESIPVIRRIKHPRWALFYWETQCKEVLNIKKENRLNGKVLIYHSAARNNDVMEEFERVAQSVWQCTQVQTPAEIWDKLICREEAKTEKNLILDNDFPEFNYRWECMKLEQNFNLLCSWIRIRQCGIKIEDFFHHYGYYHIGIYGIGYLGRLLLEELKYSDIHVEFVVDRDSEQKTEYPLFMPEEILPVADAIIVSVVHQFRYIRPQIKCACQAISLQEVLEWCIV